MNRQPNLTLVAVDTVCHDLTRLALADTLRHVEPAETLVFSDRDIGLDGVRTLPCHVTNNTEAEHFVWTGIHPHVGTSHVLLVQWDSGAHSPEHWDDAFLHYDYIGAPWPWYDGNRKVGNGGFAIRSRRLMETVASDPQRYPFSKPEDVALCHIHRDALETGAGLRWAPAEVADRFAFEHGTERGSWGFHGLWHWARLLDDDDLLARIALLPPGYADGRGDYAELVTLCASRGRWDAHAALLARRTS